MKRDLDLIRRILLKCEADPSGYAPHPLEIDGYEDEQIGFHVHVMVQAGLVDGADTTDTGAPSPAAIATSITWSGYEFLDASRDDQRWDKAKAAAKSAGGVTLDVVKGILVGLATAAARKAAGLP